MSLFSYFWPGHGSCQEQVVPESVLFPIEEDSEQESGSFSEPDSDFSDQQDDRLEELKKFLSDSLLIRANILDTYTTYHRVTWAIISTVPIINSLIRPDFGIVLSFISMALCLMVSKMEIVSCGHQAANMSRYGSKILIESMEKDFTEMDPKNEMESQK